MDDVKIEIGYALPKERWHEAAENLMQAGLMVAKYFRVMNFEGRGKEDADEWLADVALACTDRKSTRLNSSHVRTSRMPSSA